MNYKKYNLTFMQIIKCSILYFLIGAIFSYFFYDSPIPILFTGVGLKRYFTLVSKYYKTKQNHRLLHEFHDFLISLNASLEVGYSIENAIFETLPTMRNIYGEDSYMIREIQIMYNKLRLNSSIEEIFSDFSSRTDLDDIVTFSVLLSLSKKTSGNIGTIIYQCSEAIKDKLELEEEIQNAIFEKRFEQLIMMIMPFVVFVFVNITEPGFFKPLYHNIFGIVISTIMILIYLSAFLLSQKILKIEV